MKELHENDHYVVFCCFVEKQPFNHDMTMHCLHLTKTWKMKQIEEINIHSNSSTIVQIIWNLKLDEEHSEMWHLIQIKLEEIELSKMNKRRKCWITAYFPLFFKWRYEAPEFVAALEFVMREKKFEVKQDSKYCLTYTWLKVKASRANWLHQSGED